jgi:hypothetical protein
MSQRCTLLLKQVAAPVVAGIKHGILRRLGHDFVKTLLFEYLSSASVLLESFAVHFRLHF